MWEKKKTEKKKTVSLRENEKRLSSFLEVNHMAGEAYKDFNAMLQDAKDMKDADDH